MSYVLLYRKQLVFMFITPSNFPQVVVTHQSISDKPSLSSLVIPSIDQAVYTFIGSTVALCLVSNPITFQLLPMEKMSSGILDIVFLCQGYLHVRCIY